MNYRMSDMSLPGSKVIRIYDRENNTIIIPQIEKGKHYGISQVPKTKKFVDGIMTRLNDYDNLKDKDSRSRARIKNLKKEILESGHIIRLLDENSEYVKFWTNDGEYRPIDQITH